jgi:protein SCO1
MIEALCKQGTDRRTLAVIWMVAFTIAVALAAFAISKPGVQRRIANSFVRIGGPFELMHQDGEPFTQQDLLGHPHVLYFGFTYCPDIYPTTLFQIVNIVEGLGDKASPLKVVFVSVDPERDTPAVLKEYVSAFHERLSGSPDRPKR